MLKVLIEMDLLFMGGSEKQFRYIISTLNACPDCELYVLVQNKSLVDDSQQIKEFVNQHSRTHFVFLDSNAMKYNHSNRIVRLTTKMLSLIPFYFWHRFTLPKIGIDIAMVNNMTGLMAVPLLNKCKCITIYNERNTGRQVTDKRFKIKRLLKCNTVVANSKTAAAYLQGIIQKEIRVINNGLKMEKIICEEDNPHQNVRILIPGRITPIKNQLFALQSLKQSGRKNIQMILVGGCEDKEYMDEINSYIASNGLEQNVLIKGFTTDMYTEYSECDMVLLPSKEEGTPNVLLEAFMYGKPVLASNIPQNKDCMLFPEYLFSIEQPEALAELLKKAADGILFSDKKKVIKVNRKFVEDNYSLEKMEANYLKLFGLNGD